MKIVHISTYPYKGEKHANAGGVSSYMKNLLTAIPYKKGDEVFVLCNKLAKARQVYKEDQINIVRCFDRKPIYIWQIVKEIRKIKPDVIHIQQELHLFGGMGTAYMLQWLLFVLRGHKTVITLHGVVSLKKVDAQFVRENNSAAPAWLAKRALFILYRPLCIWTKRTIVHEEYFKNILVNEYRVKPEKISVIYHGVEDLAAISKQEACKAIGLNEDRDICLFMGYATGYKGIDLLIEGFGLYAQKNPRAFLVIGAGIHPKLSDDQKYLREYERLQVKASAYLPANQYRWQGFIEEKDITAYYSASDVSLYPYTISMSSSGPMSMAIGYEKPFLTSISFEEVVSDKSIIFERTAESLAQKLEEFFCSKEKFSQQLKERKQSRLWNAVGQITYTLYET